MSSFPRKVGTFRFNMAVIDLANCVNDNLLQYCIIWEMLTLEVG
jgi:hypothetical protein